MDIERYGRTPWGFKKNRPQNLERPARKETRKSLVLSEKKQGMGKNIKDGSREVKTVPWRTSAKNPKKAEPKRCLEKASPIAPTKGTKQENPSCSSAKGGEFKNRSGE